MTIRPRTEERSRFALFASVLMFAGLALAGCGGHHGSSTDNNTTLTAIIHWPALTTATSSRQTAPEITGASTSATVCIISTTSGNTGDGDPIDFTPIIRDPTKVAAGTTPIPAYTDSFDQVWNSNSVTQNPQQVRQGANNIQVRFYAQNPTGTTSGVNNNLIPSSYALLPSVGDSVVIPVVIPAGTFALGVLDPTTSQYSGNITVSTTIRSVLISPTTAIYGSTAVIPVTAYDGTGTAVAPTLQTGAASFTPGSSPVPVIGTNGVVTPNLLGSWTTTATVDGITSNTVTVTSTVGDISGYKVQGGIQYLDAAYSAIPTGAVPAASGDSISITYTGYISSTDPTNVNGVSYTPFDTANQTIPLAVTIGSNSLITGLNAGLSGMAIGDQRMIVVPFNLGYGTSQVANVPGSSTLYYIVTRTN